MSATNSTTPPPMSETNSTSPPPLSATNSTSPPPPPPKQQGLPPGALGGLIAGTVLGGVIVLIGVCVFFVFYRRKKRKEAEAAGLLGGPPKAKVSQHNQVPQWQHNAPPPAEFRMALQPKPSFPSGMTLPSQRSSGLGSGSGESQNVFTYEELAMATEGFSDVNLIGQGGFGYVHKGVLPNGKVVAIKQLKVGSGQGEREFQAEIETISRIHHRHLVSLVGYCITGDQRMLVYEFVPNNTMEFHLHGKERPTLNWATRMKIAIGSAKGLAYLHEDCQPKVIHRDIKSSNILLDDSFEAKVADFGLAKHSLDTDTHVSTRVMGTFGYMAPEYASSGKLTDKSDVFSYGVVLLELITGRRPVDRTRAFLDDSIVDWARPLLKEALEDGNYDAVVDPKLNKDYDTSEMNTMIACAAACVRHLARLRPRISQIVRALEGNLSLGDLNEGIAPGHSTVYSYGSSDYSSKQYEEDMKKFRKMALENLENDDTVSAPTNLVSQEYSGPSSEFGQQPSSSSSEGHQIQEMESQKVDKDTKVSHESQ